MLIRRESPWNALLATLLLFAFSCVHDAPKKKLRKSTKETANTTRELEPSSSQTGATPPAVAVAPEAETPKVDPAAMVARLAGAQGKLDPADHASADELAKTVEVESIGEAAIVIVSIYEAIPELSGKAQGFTEGELYPNQAAPQNSGGGPKPGSLESIAGNRHINLPGALERNPFLQSFRLQSLALKALEQISSSDTFRDATVTAVRNHAQTWSDLGAKIGMAQPNPVKVVETTAAPLPESKKVQPALKFGNGDLGNDDAIVQEAQNLADKGQYKQSVARLAQLKEDSPLYAAAQEKIRDSSNKAVQELRRLAAKAFQSAIPVSDLKTKAEYLKEARMHLEAALSTYPQADQLATVRENLAVINRDLLRISESSGN